MRSTHGTPVSALFARVKAELVARHDWKAMPAVLVVCDAGTVRATAFTGANAFPAAERAYMRAVRELKAPAEFRIYEQGRLVVFDQAEPRAPEMVH